MRIDAKEGSEQFGPLKQKKVFVIELNGLLWRKFRLGTSA